MPCFYHRTACDFNFHDLDRTITKDIQATMIGLAHHPFFPNKGERKEVVDILRENGVTVHAYGNGWPSHKLNFSHVEGLEFKKLLQRSHLGLDIQNSTAPLAHRMFEYAACGTPVITRRREEVLHCFEEDKEIILYDDRDELIRKVRHYTKHTDTLKNIGYNAFKRCRKEHDIRHRVALLMPFVDELNDIIL